MHHLEPQNLADNLVLHTVVRSESLFRVPALADVGLLGLVAPGLWNSLPTEARWDPPQFT